MSFREYGECNPTSRYLLYILSVFNEQGGNYRQGQQQVLECGRGP